MRENHPQKITLNEDLMVYQKYTLNRSHARGNLHILNEDDCHVYIVNRPYIDKSKCCFLEVSEMD